LKWCPNFLALIFSFTLKQNAKSIQCENGGASGLWLFIYGDSCLLVQANANQPKIQYFLQLQLDTRLPAIYPVAKCACKLITKVFCCITINTRNITPYSHHPKLVKIFNDCYIYYWLGTWFPLLMFLGIVFLASVSEATSAEMLIKYGYFTFTNAAIEPYLISTQS